MIKSIESQEPSKITIIKNGELVADLYVPSIECSIIDIDNIKMSTTNDVNNHRKIIRLEV